MNRARKGVDDALTAVEPLGDTRPGRAAQRPLEMVSWLILAASMAFFAWEMREIVPQIDDAFISYRYARNWVEGNGLVFNPGEYVEGYTNLLWTLLVAGGLAIGLEAETAGHLLGLMSGLAALYFTFVLARSTLPRAFAWMAGMAPILLLAPASFISWSSSGMETSLFVATTTAAFVALATDRIVMLVVALSLATLTRPDGVLAAFVLFIFLMIQNRDRLKRALIPLAVFAVVLIGLTLFRLIYYNALLPNTFFAKVGGIPFRAGVNYILGFFLSGPAILFIPALFALRRNRRPRPEVCYFALLLFYVLAIGGDSFSGWRFLLPAVPCLIALAIWGWAEVWRRDRKAGIAIAVAFPAIVLWQVLGTLSKPGLLLLSLIASIGYLAWVALRRQLRSWKFLFAIAALSGVIAFLPLRDFPLEFYGCTLPVHSPTRWKKLADARAFNRAMSDLARFFIREIEAERPSEVLVASMSIGMFGYYSRFPIIDLVGITDPAIARSEVTIDKKSQFLLPGHQRTNADYVLSRRPTHILLGTSTHAAIPAVWELQHHPMLYKEYWYSQRINGFVRRGFTSRRDPHRERRSKR